jgi:fatty-acyl-CoA synthase
MTWGFSIDLSKPITSLGSSLTDAPSADLRPQNNRAFVSGDRSKPLWHQTVWDVLAHVASRFGAREAAVFPAYGKRWSWSDLLAKCDGLAAGLAALGLVKGDRIGIWAPNRPEWLLTQFATARLGLILVNINPAYRAHELEYALNKVACKALILAPGFKSTDYLSTLTGLAPELTDCAPGRLISSRLPHLNIVIRMGEEKSPGMLNFNEVRALGGPAHRLRLDDLSRALDPDDAINIQFTSGTTGSPKGATLTHKNIVNNARFTTGTMAVTENDRIAIPVPLYHCFGMVLGTLGCATKGSTMVFPGDGFDAGETLAAISRERCTVIYGVPTMFVAMLDHPDFRNYDTTSLRTGIMAGAPCPIEVMKRVVSDMHANEVTIAYGMTETSPVSFQTHVNDPLERRVGTVGRIHPHVDVKIVDAEGRTVGIGEQGELCTRGYSVMRGYWQDEARSRESIDAAGWMHSGDLATIDREGYCNIVGRVKDMLIRGGENVYPAEIEEFLFRNPKVAEAQVFGVPDDRYGEEICAWIVLKPGQTATEEEIRAYCRGQIAHFKVPRYVRFKPSLPMTVTGKPQKFIMRDEMMAELGLKMQKTA